MLSSKLETSCSFSKDLSKELAISTGSGESVIGLKLGKRTYFEDVVGSSESSKTGTIKRSKLSSQSREILRCQVEGCNLDLSPAKDYHRKHRVCAAHSKSSKVIIRGLELRFCQQCSRFHNLSEFDQNKRSCRRRLSDHNARRRKPKPEIIRFTPMARAEGRNQISFGFNQVPLVQDSNLKLIQGSVGLLSPTKSGVGDELQETGFRFTYGYTQPLHFKEAPLEVFHPGVQVSTTSNDMEAAHHQDHDARALSLLSTYYSSSCVADPTPQQLGVTAVPTGYWGQSSNRALSLLSSNILGSCEQAPFPPNVQQPLQYHTRPLGLPHDYQQSSSSASGQSNIHFQQFQSKEPNESTFYLY